MTVFVMLSAGATVVINNKWNEDHFLQVLKDYKVPYPKVSLCF